MSLEEFTPVESWEGWSNSAEISEKYQEAAKKAGAGIKRTQKDEKKVKKYDFLLAKFLIEIIIKKKYDEVLGELFPCLEKWYGTNFLMGVFSLAYLPISNEIRKETTKAPIKFMYNPKENFTEFHDNTIDDTLRMRINQWIEDIEDVITIEPSAISTRKTIELLKTDKSIHIFMASIFTFFLMELNINISKSKAQSYSEFIIGELEKTLKKLDLDKV